MACHKKPKPKSLKAIFVKDSVVEPPKNRLTSLQKVGDVTRGMMDLNGLGNELGAESIMGGTGRIL